MKIKVVLINNGRLLGASLFMMWSRNIHSDISTGTRHGPRDPQRFFGKFASYLEGLPPQGQRSFAALNMEI